MTVQHNHPNPTTAEPRPPFPAQAQPYPGHEAEMRPRPDYGEQSYHGSGRLLGKTALVTCEVVGVTGGMPLG
jgi:hypothetical protein